MEVIPALDLRGGCCVRLLQGDFARETIFSDDPVRAALHWEELGAPRLHVVDLEGSRSGQPVEFETIERILAAVSVPVQVAGGIRRLQDAHRYLRAGAERIVFGTAAVKDENLIVEALAMDPGAVVVALDSRDGFIRTDGWLDTSQVRTLDLAKRMQDLGVRRTLATDIARDGTLSEPNFGNLEELLRFTSLAVIASGGISTTEHLRRLAGLGTEGAIVGRALYVGALGLPDALVAARTPARPV